ncbi:TRAP transporter small permease [Flaviflexus massiliensis]|uniref:TRAP transporter small permease n=1 Tax=Flaviflexus massiliensis TaxID=1522309 RepID=UPI00097D7156|nr:TRAP transporter small permease [Flaviflexus massiliensis]
MRTIPKPLQIISQALVVISGILLLFLIFLTVGDVLGRTTANKSIVGAVDISTLALVAIAFLGLAAAEIDGRHVSVDLVEMNLPAKLRIALAALRTVLLALLGLVLSWGLWDSMVSAFDRMETTNGILRLATWPAKGALVASFVLFFIVAIWKSINEFLDMRDGIGLDGDSVIVQQAQFEAEEFTGTVNKGYTATNEREES